MQITLLVSAAVVLVVGRIAWLVWTQTPSDCVGGEWIDEHAYRSGKRGWQV